MIERIDSTTAPADRAGHEARYHLAAGFVEPGETVLDAACGTGYGGAILRARGEIDYVGVERDLAVIEHPHVGRFIEADLESAFLDDPFDVAISFETVEHLARPGQFLAQLRRARRAIIASVPIIPTVGVNRYHRTDWEPGQLGAVLSGEGWGVAHTFGQASEHSEIVILRR